MRKSLCSSKTIAILCCYNLLCSVLWANTSSHQSPNTNPIAITIAGGINWLQSNKTRTIAISPYEMDTIRVVTIPTTSQWKVGFVYNALAKALRGRKFFNQLLIEGNLYYTTSSLKGEVWQHQLPQFNNYNFKAPFSSTRLMIDAKPSLFDYHKLAFYGILGIGAAWNDLGYFEQITGAGVNPSSYLALQHRVQTNFAVDLGVGIRKKITERLDVYLEYLYANLGHASEASIRTQNNTALMKPPTFSLSSQGALLGINWIF